ncbi:heavy-metal-associated domain-containing protein [Lutimonas zeaxanthinifaciens]|uniref:heavy-metal-associated domain-containing protein n=1 Tax=Lutimonas zeaxanthinifaciens TaxID=3060215 RepID=UPI00265D4E19|nr:heavy-metal-associated domain-containing protein [Lutimonas sp. YSD2104]WKK67534.1 heavy-metal-associated domain-containing protein [Lutimonas sp. YSD2104]
MKQFITILALLILNVTFAQDKNARATIEVDGVCGMCKKRIETAAVKTEGVKSAVWSIQTHELALIYDESKTNLESISESIAAVGHDTQAVKASDEAYQSIHGCCQYRKDEAKAGH